jgi:hypothetical protein
LTDINRIPGTPPIIGFNLFRPSSMVSLRKHLRHLAALVLLLWLFAAGAAVAKVCVSHVHMEDPEGCCVTMQAPTIAAASLADAVAPAQPAQPWITADARVPVIAPARQRDPQLPTSAHWDDSGQRLHLVLQRLAL